MRTFTSNWFDTSAKPSLDTVIPALHPMRILEIGSYEGASACYFIDTLAHSHPIDLFCVDTWEGGIEHAGTDMPSVFERFSANIKDAADAVELFKPNVHVCKGRSDESLVSLLSMHGRGYFDFIYIDGSHQACDVLTDATLAMVLLRVGGIMAFDDYLWYQALPNGQDPLQCPKMAVDAFVTINCRKLQVHNLPAYQLYVTKIAE